MCACEKERKRERERERKEDNNEQISLRKKKSVTNLTMRQIFAFNDA